MRILLLSSILEPILHGVGFWFDERRLEEFDRVNIQSVGQCFEGIQATVGQSRLNTRKGDLMDMGLARKLFLREIALIPSIGEVLPETDSERHRGFCKINLQSYNNPAIETL